MTTSATTCAHCRAAVEPGERFCRSCGASMSGEIPPRRSAQFEQLQQATLGDYEVIRLIGEGGMASVYLAHDIALSRKVAIKVLDPGVVRGEEMRARFIREARTAAALTHPHIIPIYTVKESEPLLYFVMKYVSGRSLDAILRDVGPLPFPMVRTILADIGGALDFAHRQGVIHRDVKPGNILVEEEGFAVITDFGIAKAAESESLTRSGTTVGTPSYLSPEACAGAITGPPADQYSLGIVGYEMITGQLPFSAESSLGMMYAQVHTPPRPSLDLRGDCPRDLHQAIMRMLEKQPADRYATLKDAVAAISGSNTPNDDHVRSHIGLLAGPRPGRSHGDGRRTPGSPISGNPVQPSIFSRPTERIRKRGQQRLIAVGVTLFALAGAGGWWQHQRSERLAQSSVVEPTPTAAPTDSLYLSAKGAADYARQRAIASGTKPIALRPGDSVRTLAESLAALDHKAEAAVLLTRAASLWHDVERPAPVATTQPAKPQSNDSSEQSTDPTKRRAVQPTSTTPAGTTTTGAPGTSTILPAPGTELSDSSVVVGYYRELQEAIESRQLGEVRRLLPNLTDKDAEGWLSLFNDRNLATLSAVFTVQVVSRRGETIFAKVVQELILGHNGKFDHRTRTDLVTLTQGPQGWRQIRSEKD